MNLVEYENRIVFSCMVKLIDVTKNFVFEKCFKNITINHSQMHVE